MRRAPPIHATMMPVLTETVLSLEDDKQWL